jgi:non-ribosomal peptide synthetase component F
LGHLQTLLEAIAIAPEQQIAQLPILTASERHQLLVDWKHTHDLRDLQDICIHQLFEAQVEQTPDAVAVSYENESLTYRELNQRANQIAQYLQQCGVKPEVLVGIYLERSLNLIVGLLAILKAGGTYLPLDPAYPPERLAFMLADSQTSLLLTQQSLLNQLPDHNCQIICLDQLQIPQLSSPPVNNTTPQHLAYILYTSGSTGQPKGVKIPHIAVVNFLQSMGQQLGITARDKLLAVTTLSFDIAVLELLLPLSVGAEVVLVSREVATNGLALAQVFTQSQATFMQATPATWQRIGRVILI